MLAILLALSAARGAPADLLLVAADDATLAPVRQRLEGIRSDTRAAWTSWLGNWKGKNVALTRTDGDPLNAVAATTLAVRRHTPKLIVVFGAARAHDPGLRMGDVVVSERFAAFDGFVSPPRAIGEGSNPIEWRKRPHLVLATDERETATAFFPADPAARAAAQKLTVPGHRVVTGVLGSAHQINREADRIAWLRDQWQTSTEDGESAHVAGVALLLGVPIVGIRVVDGTAAQAAELALQFVENWP